MNSKEWLSVIQQAADYNHALTPLIIKYGELLLLEASALHPLQSDAVEWEKVNDDVPKEKFLLLYNGNWIGVGKCFMVDQPEDEDDGILVPEWVDEAAEYIHPHPTHYMLLPKPPKP